jgi:hypothetical protein
MERAAWWLDSTCSHAVRLHLFACRNCSRQQQQQQQHEPGTM